MTQITKKQYFSSSIHMCPEFMVLIIKKCFPNIFADTIPYKETHLLCSLGQEHREDYLLKLCLYINLVVKLHCIKNLRQVSLVIALKVV